ncbi:patatin-like phospholipase family protein [Parahaliea maris]|uniref:Patatin-like phospholipase family protein n=1 Tax=Parahaliea maris TaxID=2716870 RepID=A0A5C9A1Z9_9GAMM|nr:patatin-like phospholipase family protein [Parahaliea maris]TXS94089.1 patatin-like phospholipase family protein [Parahaliea maris]
MEVHDHVHDHTPVEQVDDCCDDPNDERLLSHIAISLSGGGLRATGFHLGALDMLDRVDLLRNINILSSVSGGSLAGTSYALCQAEGKGYQECFDNLYEFLPGLNTMEEIFRKVRQNQDSLYPSGRRDLITSMANVLHEQYFSRFYETHTFGQFWDSTDAHLTEVMFNATEFKTGIAFRFQKSQFPCKIGNGNVSVDEAHARVMRMADVMAASACIPAGMEPLFFPDDFHWPRDDEPGRPVCTAVADEIERQTGGANRKIALMDGGVYDNQGVTSILLAMMRRDRARQQQAGCLEDDTASVTEPTSVEGWGDWLDRFSRASKARMNADACDDGIDLSHLRLFIISDTPVRSETFYPSKPLPKSDSNFFTRRKLGQYDAFIWVLTGLMVLSAGDGLWDLWTYRDHIGMEGGTFRKFFSFIFPTTIMFLLAAVVLKTRLTIVQLNREMEKVMPPFRHKPWHYLKKLKLGEAISMISLRVGSTVALTSKVYMNRIRQLSYSTVYSASLDEHSLSGRIMTNEISTLLDDDKRLTGVPAPTEEMCEIVDMATHTKTALWLNPHVTWRGYGEMDILVSAGEMTTCYNLMRHLRKRYGAGEQQDIPPGSRADALYQRALALWEELREDPMALVDQRKESGRLSAS